MKSLLLAGLLATGSALFAGPINISFNAATLTGTPGSTLHVTGSLTNTLATTQFLNDANVSGLIPSMVVDVLPFFDLITGAPISLAASPGAGSSASNITMFNIFIPGSVTIGTYSGTFTVLGGASGEAQDIVGTQAFTVNVISDVPEPATWGLMTLATGAAVLVRRRNRKV